MKETMKKVLLLLSLLFLLMAGYLVKVVFWDAPGLITNSYNPRVSRVDDEILRGKILDANGNVLAETEDGARVYPYGKACAHVTGYLGVGKTGMEAAAHFILEKPHLELWQRCKGILTGEAAKGNSVALTVDASLQELAYEKMAGRRGAVVMLEPSTGKVLAMTSYPSYDPATVADQWDNLRLAEDSPLLNRGTQGKYPPGSTFKLVTMLAAMRYLPEYETFTWACTGETKFQDKVIHCYDNTAHGLVDMDSAMADSCNCYFAKLALEVGGENLRKTAESLGFNSGMSFLNQNITPTLTIDKKSTESALVETAIGQGETLVTPLYMAMLTGAIANDGIMMEPYLRAWTEDADGVAVDIAIPKAIGTVLSTEESNRITQAMVAVVEEGTGHKAKNKNYAVAAKTGTAENAEGKDHAWVVAFAPADNPQVAIAIVLEQAGSGSGIVPLAAELLSAAIHE